jgi:hypothetical protein
MAPAQPRETIDLILLGGERSDETRKDFVAAEIQATAWANVISGPGRPALLLGRLDLRIPAIVTTCSDGSRPPVPIDRDQFDGAVRCIF